MTTQAKAKTTTLDDVLAEAKFAPQDEGYADVKEAVSQMVARAAEASPGTFTKVDRAAVDRVIAEIDAKISAQLNQILHNKDFQRLESAVGDPRLMTRKLQHHRKHGGAIGVVVVQVEL